MTFTLIIDPLTRRTYLTFLGNELTEFLENINLEFSFLEDQVTEFRYARLAQSVEQRTENPCVRGSIPRAGTTKKP
jgi:hypothetical protein